MSKKNETSHQRHFKVINSEKCNLYWGDIHGHSSISPDVFFISPECYYIHARDHARLDFSAMTDHDDPRGVSNIRKWQKVQDLNRKFHDPHKFVTFIGYEWTASNDYYDFFSYFAKGPTRKKILKRFSKILIRCKPFGHKSVYFSTEKVPERIYSHQDPDSNTPEKLWNKLKPWKAITIPHHTLGGPTQVSYWKFRNDEMEPFVEIYSYHGNSESMDAPLRIWYPYGEKNSVRTALNLGYRLGFSAGTDGHSGKGGDIRGLKGGANFIKILAKSPKNPGGGLTAVFAEELTRKSIWDAFINRRMYGTTGARIVVDFRTFDHFMGEEFSTNEVPSFRFEVDSLTRIKFVDIIKNGIITFRLKCKEKKCNGEFMDKKIEPGINYYYLRVIRMDEEMAWASPIWIKYS